MFSFMCEQIFHMVIVDLPAGVGIPSLDTQHTEYVMWYVVRDQLFQGLSVFFFQGRSLC